MRCPQCCSANWWHVVGLMNRPMGRYWFWERSEVSAAKLARWLNVSKLNQHMAVHEFAVCRSCELEVS